MSDIVEALRSEDLTCRDCSDRCARAADEIERLQKRISGLEQALSQAGDCIELAEAEQRGYARGTKEVERLRALHVGKAELVIRLQDEIERLQGMVAKDTGTWQDLWIGERAANDRLRAALSEIAAMGHGQTPGEAFTGDDASLMHDIASRVLESSLTTEPLVASEPNRRKEPMR